MAKIFPRIFTGDLYCMGLLLGVEIFSKKKIIGETVFHFYIDILDQIISCPHDCQNFDLQIFMGSMCSYLFVFFE